MMLLLALSFSFLSAGAVSRMQLQGFEYMKAKNYAKALECYSAALKEKTANRWQILVNMGTCYSELGEYNKALSSLLDSITQGGLHPTQCVNVSAVYQKLGDNDKALSWLNAACTLDPQATANSEIQVAMRKLQDRSQYPTGSQTAPDYFSSLISIRKWHKEAMPIKVYVRKNTQIPEFYDEFASIVRDSLDQWCAPSGGALSYRLVDNKDAANVICDYTDRRELLDPDHELGIEGSTQTRVRMDDNTVDWANMVILVRDRPGSATFRDRIFLTQTCLHELGHVFGMHGHSPNNKDAMFPAATRHSAGRLSVRDKDTISRIYR